MNPLESSFLIHKAMRFDSKGGRIPDVISDNYEKLAPSADTRLRVNRSGIQQKIIMNSCTYNVKQEARCRIKRFCNGLLFTPK